MATKSMYKNIKIKSKPLAHSFIRALENAQNFTNERAIPNVKVQGVRKENVKDFFGDK